MINHLGYLSYVVRHKWFVARGCFRRGLYWQGIVHDWSKFLPGEWVPYAQFFYGGMPRNEADRKTAGDVLGYDPYPSHNVVERVRRNFDRAWLKHQHRSPHHWQHWVLREDSGAIKLLEMPRRYALEMLADWDGAGRAITGKWGDTPTWYAKNRDKIQLAPETRAFVDRALGYSPEITAAFGAPR